jgi:hypothetical protein
MPQVEDVITEPVQLREVRFSVAGTGLSTEQSLMKSASLQSMNIQHLEYWVYKKVNDYSNEVPLQYAVVRVQKDDNKTDISLTLPNGDYAMFFYGSSGTLEPFDNEKRRPYSLESLDHQSQMFSSKIEFSLNDTIAEVKRAVTLERAVGRVELVIEDLDKLPAEVQSITPVLRGFLAVSWQPRALAYPTSLNLMNESVTYSYMDGKGYNKYFPTIPRSQFASINKDNPIVFYTLPTNNLNRTGGSIIWPELYIQGSKDLSVRSVNAESPMTLSDPNIVFMRKVAEFDVFKNKTTRYTGKIGGLDATSIAVDYQQEWTEIATEIGK